MSFGSDWSLVGISFQVGLISFQLVLDKCTRMVRNRSILSYICIQILGVLELVQAKWLVSLCIHKHFTCQWNNHYLSGKYYQTWSSSRAWFTSFSKVSQPWCFYYYCNNNNSNDSYVIYDDSNNFIYCASNSNEVLPTGFARKSCVTIIIFCKVYILTSTSPELLDWLLSWPTLGSSIFVHLQPSAGISDLVQNILHWHPQLVWFDTSTYLVSSLVRLDNFKRITSAEDTSHDLWAGGKLGSHVPEQRCSSIWWGLKPDCWTGNTVGLSAHNSSFISFEDTITECKKKVIEWIMKIRNQLSFCFTLLLGSLFVPWALAAVLFSSLILILA